MTFNVSIEKFQKKGQSRQTIVSNSQVLSSIIKLVTVACKAKAIALGGSNNDETNKTRSYWILKSS